MRTWSLGAAVVAVLVLVAGWFLLVSPTKAKITDLRTQTATQQAANTSLQTQINQLKLQNKDLPAQEAALAAIRQHLPATANLQGFVINLTAIAQASGVQLVSVSPGLPTAVTVAAPPVVVTPSAAASPSASASSSSGAATDETVAPAIVPQPSSPLKMIPIAINVTGGYYNVVSFFNKVESLRRSMLVYGVVITPATVSSADSSGFKVTAAVSARIFYSPPVATPATTPVGGATPAASGAVAPATAS
jgi:Tfp pilus assembly protein PilO